MTGYLVSIVIALAPGDSTAQADVQESGAETAPVTPAPIANAAETIPQTTGAKVVLSGYAEVFYQWNANEPSNGITNFRGFDNRHDTITLANTVVDAVGTSDAVTAHITLQVGHTPETYYLAEPSSPGTGAAGSTGAATWKLLQQANISYRAPIGTGLLIEGGLFLSPIGPEGMAVKDQWNWSRSNLFFGLPFYHTGARLSYGVTDRLTTSIMACNGWNSVVDNNTSKSVDVQATYVVADRLTWNFVYFGGVERGVGAPEGEPWRNLFDSYVVWYAHPALSFLLHGDVGFEETAFGRSDWAAGAIYARLRATPHLYIAGRADLFDESVAENAQGRAGAIFWPSSQVMSQTLTCEVRPQDNVSFRLEYRHDAADDPMFFDGDVATDVDGAFIPDADTQNTLTFGMTTWF